MSIVREMRSYLLAAAVAVAVLGFTRQAGAGEILDNEKLLKAINSGLAWEVIDNKINLSGANCQFDDSVDALAQFQKAALAQSWKAEEIKLLHAKIMKVAGSDKKRLNELVVRALNVFENCDPNVFGSDGNDDYVRMMRTLIREGGKAAVPYLLEHTEEESERKRGGVVDALGRIGDKSESVMRVLTLMLFDRSKPVRKESAVAIQKLAGPTTCDDLIARLGQKTDKLDGVAMALGFLGEPKAISPLTHILKISLDSDTRVCAAFALGTMRARTPEATDALLEAILDEHDENLRESAGRALGMIGDRRAPSYVIRAIQRYSKGREEQIKNLSFFKAAESVEFLIEQLDSDNPKMKRASLETLQVLTGETNFHDKDEWLGWWEAAKARPDYIKSNTETMRVPDANGGRPVESSARNVEESALPTTSR